VCGRQHGLRQEPARAQEGQTTSSRSQPVVAVCWLARSEFPRVEESFETLLSRAPTIAHSESMAQRCTAVIHSMVLVSLIRSIIPSDLMTATTKSSVHLQPGHTVVVSSHSRVRSGASRRYMPACQFSDLRLKADDIALWASLHYVSVPLGRLS
jgi:hypothetical protein